MANQKQLLILVVVCCQNVFTDKAEDKYGLTFSKKKAGDYDTARNRCADEKKRLVNIEDEEKSDAILEYLKSKNDTDKYWTAGRRSMKKVRGYVTWSDCAYPFRWYNGHRLAYSNWAEGRPNNVAKEYNKSPLFVNIQCDGKDLIMTDGLYNQELKYICEPDRDDNYPDPGEPENPYGYFLSGFKVTDYKNIMNFCSLMEEKKKPIKLDTEKKVDLLRKMTKADNNRIAYLLPAKRENVKSRYKWENGTEVTNANWGPNQPSKEKDELCLQFNYDPSEDKLVWASSLCKVSRRIACENE